jgi:hypothetical protein
LLICNERLFLTKKKKVHNECPNGQNHQPPQTTSYNNRRGSITSPPDSNGGGITFRYSEVFPTQLSSSSSTVNGENGGAAFLTPPLPATPLQQRSDVIVKLTAASLDSDLNM